MKLFLTIEKNFFKEEWNDCGTIESKRSSIFFPDIVRVIFLHCGKHVPCFANSLTFFSLKIAAKEELCQGDQGVEARIYEKSDGGVIKEQATGRLFIEGEWEEWLIVKRGQELS